MLIYLSLLSEYSKLHLILNLIPEILFGLCHMKEYARSKAGAYCIHISDMLERITLAKSKDREFYRKKRHRNYPNKILKRSRRKKKWSRKQLNQRKFRAKRTVF